MAHETHIYMISDLHLGGEDGFSMTPPSTVSRLAELVRRVIDACSSSGDAETWLVLAGDIVDFLAEEPFEAFSSTEVVVRTKLDRIMQRTKPFWDALKLAVERGVRVVLLVGNHDVELSMSVSRRLLRAHVGAELELLLDGEALPIGPVLIEHGNRNDPWNVVRHGDVRAFRSATSRREPPPLIPETPGSRLVVDVINDIKRIYPAIDLLKPEAAVIPLIAFLDPSKIFALRRAFKPFLASRTNRYSSQGTPTGIRNIGPLPDTGAGELPHEAEVLGLAEEIAAELEHPTAATGPAAVRPVGARVRAAGRGARGDTAYRLLAKGLRHLLRDDRSFDLDSEHRDYLRSAKAALQRGFRVVAYGHTHLAKMQRLEDGWYVNSGTWADLVRIPPDVLSSDDEVAIRALRGFLEEPWRPRREPRATFVEMRWSGSRDVRLGLHEFHQDGTTTVLEQN